MSRRANTKLYLVSILYRLDDGTFKVQRWADRSRLRAQDRYKSELESISGRGTISLDVVTPDTAGLTQINLLLRMLEDRDWEAEPRKTLMFAEFDVPGPCPAEEPEA